MPSNPNMGTGNRKEPMMATIYYADGRTEERSTQEVRSYELEQLQAIVGGDIEMIPVPGGKIMVLNANGLELGLPRNEKATQLAGFPSPRELMERLREEQPDFFVGQVTDTETGYIPGDVLVGTEHELRWME